MKRIFLIFYTIQYKVATVKPLSPQLWLRKEYVWTPLDKTEKQSNVFNFFSDSRDQQQQQQQRSKWLHCVSCKIPFSNAWDLMVHVQTAHMMNIYQLSDPAKVKLKLRNSSFFRIWLKIVLSSWICKNLKLLPCILWTTMTLESRSF